MKRLMTVLTISTMITGCGKIELEHNHKGLDTVNVVHTINIDNLYELFIKDCKARHPEYTEEELDLCASELVASFLNAFGDL